jgi:hypothetical protein
MFPFQKDFGLGGPGDSEEIGRAALLGGSSPGWRLASPVKAALWSFEEAEVNYEFIVRRTCHLQRWVGFGRSAKGKPERYQMPRLELIRVLVVGYWI